MADSKYFGIPFATSGDKATIPEATQPSGAISFTQGFGPDYERDPATDPLAKRVPRDETNELYFQITNALKFLQLYGAPEWFATDDAGNPVSYPVGAIVRRVSSGLNTLWFSLSSANTAEPGSDPLKWVRFTPYSVQNGSYTFTTSSGTPNALTATLTPAPLSLVAGMSIRLLLSQSNTDAATLSVNGGSAIPILTKFGTALSRGTLVAGSVATLNYDGAAWRLADLSLSEIPVNFGQCRLSVQSATVLLLSPYSGNSLVVNGSPVKIPSGGVSLSNSGLAANTVYNIYAFLSGSTLTLEASTTGHSADASTGVEIKTGDPSRTLVGKIRTNATSNFADTPAYRGCINWFNRRQLNVTGGSGTNSTSSSSYIDLGVAIACSFLAWGDEALFSVVNGFARNDTVGGQANISLTLDGVQGFASDSGMQAPTANYNQALISTASYTPAEGWRTLSYVGRTGGTGNMVSTMAIQTIVRG